MSNPMRSAFILALVALISWLPAAEPAPEPAPQQERPDAGAQLEAWAREKELLEQGRRAAAQHHYDIGQRALAAGNTPEALRALIIAVDYEPGNAAFRKALDRARAIAGVAVDPRGVHIDEIADSLLVQQQQLWIEISTRLEEGRQQIERGEYHQAELTFQMARVRLESLPYADERREAELRRVESLLAETRTRRRELELTESTAAVRAAHERERELRVYELRLERDRIDAMLSRALKARERREYDETILLCEQVLRINRAETRAHDLLVRARRERHAYIRQITADAWDEEHKLLSERIRADMLPQLDLVEYPLDWAEIDARRSAPSRGAEDARAAWRDELERKLDQQLTLDFPDLEIQEVVAFLQRNTDVNIVLDPQVLSMGAVPPVQIQLTDVRLRNALEFIMLQTGLRFTLQDEAIYISSEAGLRGDVEMRVYDIRDLTIGVTQFPGPSLQIPEPGGHGAQLIPEIADERPPEAGEFLDIIERVVAPDSWMEESVGITEWNNQLIVTQTPQVHRQIAELLRTMRNQSAVQISVKVRFLTVENALLEEIGVDWNNFTGPPGWDVVQPRAYGQPVLGPNPMGGGGVAPPWWAGGYWGTPNGRQHYGGQITNNLGDYSSQSGLDVSPSEGLISELQIFEDPSGFLGRAVLRAVEKTRRGNVVLAPYLTMLSGQRAHLVRMNQQSYVADYVVVGTQYDPQVTVISYGTVLDVEAIASADRKWITLTMRPTTTEVLRWRRYGDNRAAFGGIGVDNTDAEGNPLNAIAGQFPIMIPELSYRAVRTSVTIPDGGSLLMAGMTLGSSQRAHSGVPVLSHIPFLGRLFSKNGRSEREMRDMIYVSGDIVLFDEIEKSL